jgi:hypothetical protein
MKILYKKSFYLSICSVITAILYSCGGPSACDCRENDLLGAKADSTVSADCDAGFEELSRDDQNEFKKEYKACK